MTKTAKNDFRFAKSPNGHDMFTLKSWLQKAIRRAEESDALYVVAELDLAGFPGAAWNTLLTCASEDIGLADSNVAVQVGVLHQTAKHFKGSKHQTERLMLVQATLICVRAKTSRLVDNALTVVIEGARPAMTEPDWAKPTEDEIKLWSMLEK